MKFGLRMGGSVPTTMSGLICRYDNLPYCVNLTLKATKLASRPVEGFEKLFPGRTILFRLHIPLLCGR
ncbi:hypothetical protein CEXT_111401 [Caerostris extrusa]|uniref:Uncharacterized protein n=1 Tax=Caerostris extrusa TaxID=172846 RepID=A0AAV4WTU9_CAEEX|nr:hypothetical protein CEXT_111401 [Caerostris extrusa]